MSASAPPPSYEYAANTKDGQQPPYNPGYQAAGYPPQQPYPPQQDFQATQFTNYNAPPAAPAGLLQQVAVFVGL